MDFAVPLGDHVKINEREKIDMYLDLARELKKPCDTRRVTVINNCSSYVRKGPQKPGKETGGIGNQKKNRDHPDQSIVRIG